MELISGHNIKGLRMALAAAAFLGLGLTARAAVPAPWSERDIGAVGLAGSSSHASGTFTVTGSGADIWGTADAFRFVYQRLSGNTQVVARVASLTNTNAWAKAGLMIREDLTANSRNAFVCVTPANGVSFQSRASVGGTSASQGTTGLAAPRWLKLARSGDNFTAWQSADGAAWTQVGSVRVVGMQPTVYVGLAVTSHDNARLATASLGSVQLQAPPALLVAGSTLLNASDAAVKRRLETLGYAVTVKAAASAVAADANGKDLVVISSTVASGDVNTKFRAAAVPVITWENAIYDDLGMTGTVANTDFGTTAPLRDLGVFASACDRATMYTAAKNWGDGCHDLAAGLSGSFAVSRAGHPVTWGRPGAAAVRIAFPGTDQAKSAVFAYEKGAAMPGLAAPARRVGLYFGDNTFANLTGRGQALFDAAVHWATGTRYSITKKILVLNFDPILEGQGGIRLSQWGRNRTGWWGGPAWPIVRNYLADLTEASGGYLRWRIARYADIPDEIDRWVPITGPEQFDSPTFPEQRFIDNYEYALSTWDWGGAGSRMPNGGNYGADYDRILNEYGVDAKVNAGEVDEVILPSHPFSGVWESAMAGPRAYPINGGAYWRNTNRNFAVMGMSYERGLSEVLENFGHRSEWLISRMHYGRDYTVSYNTCYYRDFDPNACGPTRQYPALNNLWDRFSVVEENLPGKGAVGGAHWAPNAMYRSDEYVWHKPDFAYTNADDWMFNYPRLQGDATRRQVNAEEWKPMAQDGDYGRGFKKWWYFHMPRVPGHYSAAGTTDHGKLNNWWEYLANFDRHPETDD